MMKRTNLQKKSSDLGFRKDEEEQGQDLNDRDYHNENQGFSNLHGCSFLLVFGIIAAASMCAIALQTLMQKGKVNELFFQIKENLSDLNVTHAKFKALEENDISGVLREIKSHNSLFSHKQTKEDALKAIKISDGISTDTEKLVSNDSLLNSHVQIIDGKVSPNQNTQISNESFGFVELKEKLATQTSVREEQFQKELQPVREDQSGKKEGQQVNHETYKGSQNGSLPELSTNQTVNLLEESNCDVQNLNANGNIKLSPEKKCIRIVVPFPLKKIPVAKQFFKWLGVNPPCKESANTCAHVHMLLYCPEQDNRTKIKKSKGKNGKRVIQKTSYCELGVEESKPMLQGLCSSNSCISQPTTALFSMEEGINQNVFSYRVLKHLVFETQQLGYQYMALMGIDVYPIKDEWLDLIYSHAFSGQPFFIKGTSYKASKKDCPEYGHISDQSIWHTGNLPFLEKTFAVLDSAEDYLSILSSGYAALFYQIFVSPYANLKAEGTLYCEGKINTVQWNNVNHFSNDSTLKSELAKGYIDIPYIINNRPNQREGCKVFFSQTKRILSMLRNTFPKSALYICQEAKAKSWMPKY